MNVRNGADWLPEALDSVMAQTFTDWELIFWDDRSTDDSAKIFAQYSDDRFCYFLSPEETLLGRARELAIRQARGEWLAFLDQDDIWLPDKLGKQMALVKDQPEVGMVYGRTLIFRQSRERDFDHRHEFQLLPEGDIFEQLITDGCFISMSSAVLRRSACHPIPDVVQVIPDYYLFVTIARHHLVRAVQEVVCRYRWHGTNMTNFFGRMMHEENLWLIDQWAHCLDLQVVARRRKIYHTLLALEEMRCLATATGGITRLLARGSVGFLFSRPFARAFRAVRRKVGRPYWLRAYHEDGREKTRATIAQGPACPERAGYSGAGGHDQGETQGPSVAGSAVLSPPPRVAVLGTQVTASTFAAARETLDTLVQRRLGAYISCANAYSVTMAHADRGYRQIINGASYVTADGMPIVWALRCIGYQSERVHNDDLFLACCEHFGGWRHFLVGGRAGQSEEVANEMRRRFPGITVVGTHATPVRPVPEPETEIILEKIRIARPNVIWVGMGTPAQDYWMAAVAPRAGMPMVGVGSLFDLLTGRTRVAPEWIKRSGLQWLFRLCQEPRRLAFRYLYYNSRFLVAFSRQLALHLLQRLGCMR